MADSTSIEQPFPIFFDKAGKPLDSGYVYIGEYGKNPQTNPIQTFWDEALTQPAVQPIRTINGYYSRHGTPSRVFIQGLSCSITVRDKYQTVVYSDLKTSGKVAGLINASAILDDSGLNQQQINDKSVTTVDSIADLITIQNPRNGQVVFAKSYYAGLNKGGSNYIFKDGSWGIIASNIADPEIFGAKGGLNDDQQVFTDLSTNYTYALGKEYTVPVWRGQARKYIGNNTTVHLDSVNGDTTVCLQIRDDSNYSDVSFVNNPTQTKPWTYAVLGNNSVMNNVGFYNFDDVTDPPNSWGIYLEGRKNITLNNCHFGNNGVSDIAIVDNVHNITINNARNDLEGVSLDIEPNQAGAFTNNSVSQINVNGGHYSSIHVLENSFTAYGIKDINVSGADVDLLELRGGIVNIRGGKVKDIKGNWYPFNDFEGYQNEYLGGLRIDNAHLSENLVRDPYFQDIFTGTATSYWAAYTPFGYSMTRKYGSNGSYLELNSAKTSLQQLYNRNFIDIPQGATHICVAVNHAVSNGADINFNVLRVDLYDSIGAVVKTLSYKGCRVGSNKDSGWVSEEGVFRVPPDLAVAKAKIIFACKEKASYRIRSIGLYALSLIDSVGSFNETLNRLALPVKKSGVSVIVNIPNGATTPQIARYEVDFLGVDVGDAVSAEQVVYNQFVDVRARVISKDRVILTFTNTGVLLSEVVSVKLSSLN